MAHLHVKTPGGTTYSIDLDTINTPSGSVPSNWAYLPNGCIIQWGRITNYGIITFPMEFPSECYSCVRQLGGSNIWYNAPYADHYQVLNLNKTGFTSNSFEATYVSPSYYIAVGK